MISIENKVFVGDVDKVRIVAGVTSTQDKIKSAIEAVLGEMPLL